MGAGTVFDAHLRLLRICFKLLRVQLRVALLLAPQLLPLRSVVTVAVVHAAVLGVEELRVRRARVIQIADPCVIYIVVLLPDFTFILANQFSVIVRIVEDRV